MGRKKLEIDGEKVKQLAGMGCTVAEIAALLDCSKRTLEIRFCASLKDGRERMNGSLKRMQYLAAESGNVAMLIWLGKQYLGQRDTQAIEISGRPKAVRDFLSDDTEATK